MGDPRRAGAGQGLERELTLSLRRLPLLRGAVLAGNGAARRRRLPVPRTLRGRRRAKPGRSPTAVPATPPRSAPIAPAPYTTNRCPAVTLPAKWSGVTICRRVQLVDVGHGERQSTERAGEGQYQHDGHLGPPGERDPEIGEGGKGPADDNGRAHAQAIACASSHQSPGDWRCPAPRTRPRARRVSDTTRARARGRRS